jgi:hypothetical protein
MSHLNALGKPPPTFVGEHWVPDGFGLTYRFWRYSIDSCPDWYGAVYAFVSYSYGVVIHTSKLEYVGKAICTKDRLNDHDRISAARGRGATEVWVHAPMPGDPISYHEVERRLIHTYDPPMNKQRPLPLGLLAFGLTAPAQFSGLLGRLGSR